MNAFLTHLAADPDAELPWGAITATAWWQAMAACPQDPVYHAEGDVATHTRMVVDALRADPEWRGLPDDARAVTLLAALLHDIGKPATTRAEPDGRVTADGHSRVGTIEARRLLWEAGVPFATREAVCGLIRWHQRPFFLIEQANARYLAYTVSMTARCDWLTVLANADIRGRVCPDAERPLLNAALFREFCADEGCLTGPRAFPSDHSRFLYFRSGGERDPDYRAYETEGRPTFLLLSGLPGAGKDTWIRTHGPDWPVISLDGIRAELKIPPTDSQEPVLAVARERAREILRRGDSLVWNATNVSRELRTKRLRFADDYDAIVRVVYVEATAAVQKRQNANRDGRVPDNAMARIFRQWEVPDLTEAHTVEYRVAE
jgi:putative nucleotidyltransferase with HDIG domain